MNGGESSDVTMTNLESGYSEITWQKIQDQAIILKLLHGAVIELFDFQYDLEAHGKSHA